MHDKHTNRLIHATSPYLLQHAHNPVDWFEWGTEALEKAKAEDKIILVSIGYSSCHWCHVMERESFEQEHIAEVMNSFFVCIKVDREERPDIDQLYMDAAQALGVNGGWPLNVFLTPDQKPFFGGTYFSSQVWVQVLTNINTAYQNRKADILASAESLTQHLANQGVKQYQRKSDEENFTTLLHTMYGQLEKKFDKVRGGLDRAPKFIMPAIWLWMLRYAHITNNRQALAHTLFTLRNIGEGGMYDQLGGGFARYSVDGQWFVPHFEKMLYDNAQLLSLYSEAYAVSKDEYFKSIVVETYDWLLREMTHDEGGFYSALDADSEGVEGKYYTWNYSELLNLIAPKYRNLFAEFFEITPEGNWEHGNNILKRHHNVQTLLDRYNIGEAEFERSLASVKLAALPVREKRIKPGLDDKIVAGWNAMTITGLVDAYHAFGEPRFLQSALLAMQFLEKHLCKGQKIYRSFKNKTSHTEGFLDDYAFVIQAYLKLYEATFNEAWLTKADTLTEYVLENFYDAHESFFFFTSAQAETLIARKKEVFDNVIPSSNAVMVQNLYRLGTLLDSDTWKNLAEHITQNLSHLISQEPEYMAYWGIVLSEINHTLAEVVFTGANCLNQKRSFRKQYQPFSMVMGAHHTSTLPLLQGKLTDPDQTTIYVCINKTCKLPVSTVDDALKQLAGE